MTSALTGAVLCAGRAASDSGFAWDFIARLWAGVADRLASRGRKTYVAFPALRQLPAALEASAAEVVELDATFARWESVRRTAAFVRGHGVRITYLTGHPPVSFAFAALRASGVRRIVTHDHSSGTRTRPQGFKRAAKRVLAGLPAVRADVAVAVSDYVARRQTDIALMPADRIRRIWNGVAPRAPATDAHAALGLQPDRQLVMCACRAAPEKGVEHLLRAFEIAWTRSGREPRPMLVYIGDGPDLARLEGIRTTLQSAPDVTFTGYRPDAPDLVASAHVAVVPSVWHEAFGLSALEPMAAGRPVVATRVGGLPEIVDDGVTGILVPPGDSDALAAAIMSLLEDDARAERMGDAGRRRARDHFTLERQIAEVTAVLLGDEGAS